MDQDAIFDSRRRASDPRRATKDDAGRVVDLFTASFADDPVISWLIRRDGKRDWARRIMFNVLVERFGLPGGEVWTADDYKVAALWVPPEKADMKQPWWEELTLLPKIVQVSSLSGMGRMDAQRKVMDKNHPHAPHWYLMTIGVDPSMQGKGLGSALLDATLAKVDATKMPAYLESSNPKNVPLYERHGFKVTSEFRARPDAPPLWGMWREPRAR